MVAIGVTWRKRAFPFVFDYFVALQKKGKKIKETKKMQ